MPTMDFRSTTLAFLMPILAQNGLLSALPYFIMWICSMVSAAIADWIIARKYWSVLTVRKFFTTVGEASHKNSHSLQK